MRIGFYTHYLDKYPTSAPAFYQIKLLEGLSKFKNIEIVLIHHKRNPNSNIYKEYEEAIVRKLPYLGEKDINFLNLDIIHFNAIPWSWRVLVRKVMCKKIVTVHGDVWWVEPQLGYNRVIEVVKRFVEPKTIRYFDKIIAVSYSIKNTLIKYLKCPEEKIRVVYGGIDHKTFYPRTADEVEMIKTKYEINGPYIFHVSNYSKIKNPDALFKVFKLIKKEICEIILVIAGKGWKEKYEDRLNKYKLNKKDVKFLGWVDHKDLPALYTGAEVFFSPSYHETFGFPNLEAMACGTPVVSSNKYAIPEIVGNAAILHDPDDYKAFANSIITLLTNENIRRNLIKKGLRHAKRFSWEKTARKTYMIYKEVAQNGE